MNNKQATPEVKSKLLPIYIVKKDSTNSSVLDHKKVNFQINYGNNYHINYKYFTPKGFHLAKGCKPDVACTYNEQGLNVPSVTFTYVKDAVHHAKPIWVNYIDVDSNQRIRKGSVNGTLGQEMNVTHHVMVPQGYHLCADQKTMFKVSQYIQSIDLMVKRNVVKPKKAPKVPKAKVVSSAPKPSPKPKHVAQPHPHHVNHLNHIEHVHGQGQAIHHHNNHNNQQVTNHSNEPLHNGLDGSIKTLESNLQKYNCSLAIKLIHGLLSHNLDFFKSVITSIFSNMKYKGIDNLQVTPQEHKVSGVIKKYLYNNNQVNFTFVRAKLNDIHDEVTVSQVRDFVTSVMDHNSSKGIFITTSHFSPKAKKEAERHSIILVDDMHLAKLMINNDVGVKPRQIFKIVDLDKAFFK